MVKQIVKSTKQKRGRPAQITKTTKYVKIIKLLPPYITCIFTKNRIIYISMLSANF